MRRPLSSSMDCPEAPSSGLCSPSREPKRPKQGFDVSPKLSANSARDGPSTCWREVSAICQTGSNAALHGASLACFLRKPAFGHLRTRREEGHLYASPAHFHIWYNTSSGIRPLHPGKGEHTILMHPHESIDWYPIVKRYTTRLVHIRSVSPGKGEIQVAPEDFHLLQEDGLASSYTAIGLDPLIDDPAGRCNGYAFLRGKHPQTICLLGHIDTVATGDFGALEPFALDPGALATHVDQLAAIVPGLAQDLAAHPGDWMLGRGSGDMKSGDAVNIAVMRHLAALAREDRLELSVVLLATPDEENESAGVLQAVQFLLRLREQYGLEYLGAINTDYVTALYPGDPHRYIYTGTVGKLLPTFLVIRQPSHVGDPFDGLDANLLASELIRDLSMNDELCDHVRGQSTPPPVTLKFTDLKTSYDVQLPFASYFYLNVLTLSTTPAQLLDKLVHRAQSLMGQLLRRVYEPERRWKSKRPPVYQDTPPRQRTG